MNERATKVAVIAALVLFLPAAACLAYFRPGYFTSPTDLARLLLGECLIVALWFYRRVFFPLVLASFLFAGIDLPLGGVWTAARWFCLGAGALVGCFIVLKERVHRFRLFHAVAALAVLSALVSAVVSRYPGVAILKALSLLLLFVYAGTGARLAVTGRESRFFTGLLIGCEVFVAVVAGFYFLGVEAMGNPNSLGAVMGVVAAPLLLWGTLVEENEFVLRRRQILYVVAMYLTFHSHSRSALAAVCVSCGLLCLALRRYKLLGQGVVIVLILVAGSAIVNPEAVSKSVSHLEDSVLYKGKDPTLGVLSSRQTPWQTAEDSINKHFWLGAGFGTTDNGEDASQSVGQHGHFASSQDVTSENGSSYLSIATWVGMLGILPFALLLLVLLRGIVRTVSWTLSTGNPFHPAIPLAMVMVAGLIDAGFEDWLFAVGYYLCVFFWSLAFVFMDFVPASPLTQFSFKWRSTPVAQGWSGTAPSR